MILKILNILFDHFSSLSQWLSPNFPSWTSSSQQNVSLLSRSPLESGVINTFKLISSSISRSCGYSCNLSSCRLLCIWNCGLDSRLRPTVISSFYINDQLLIFIHLEIWRTLELWRFGVINSDIKWAVEFYVWGCICRCCSYWSRFSKSKGWARSRRVVENHISGGFGSECGH